MEALMIDKRTVEKAMFAAIDEVNQLLPTDHKLEKSPSLALSGSDGRLDSLGLVNLIVAVEQKIDEHFGVTVVLVNEDSMSLNENPFKTVSTLTDYIVSRLEKLRGA